VKKTRKLDSLAKVFQAVRYVDKNITQITKVRTSCSLKETEHINYENSSQQI